MCGLQIRNAAIVLKTVVRKAITLSPQRRDSRHKNIQWSSEMTWHYHANKHWCHGKIIKSWTSEWPLTCRLSYNLWDLVHSPYPQPLHIPNSRIHALKLAWKDRRILCYYLNWKVGGGTRVKRISSLFIINKIVKNLFCVTWLGVSAFVSFVIFRVWITL